MQHTQSFDVVDDKTFKLTLKNPYGFVIASLAKPGSTVPFMMPKRIADTPGSQQIKEATGSGPWIFKADEWKPGEKVVYVKNPNYKPRAEPASGPAGGKVAKFDRIEWLAMPDIQTAANALMTGEIDAIEALPLDLKPMVEKNKSIAFMRGKYPGQYTPRAELAAPAARQPEDPRGDRLCDRPAARILEAQISNEQFFQLCKAYFICSTPLASTTAMDGRLEGNVAKARELLKEAGYDGTPLVVMHTTDPPGAHCQPRRRWRKPTPRARRLQGRHAVDGLADDRGPHQQARSAGAAAAGASSSRAGARWISSDPIVSQNLNASCEKATPGWPCDKLHRGAARPVRPWRAMRRRRRRSPTRSRPAPSRSARTIRWVSGTASSPTAPNTKDWMPPMTAMLFWNAEKTQ